MNILLRLFRNRESTSNKARTKNIASYTPEAVLLTITAPIPGDDLGYLLHKNPARTHSFDLTFGKAHVFYPQLSENRSQVALLLDVDPVGLVRGRRDSSGEGSLDQYVNDRPYAASSFDSVAIAKVFGTAMGGRSKERQHLADQSMNLEATIAAMPCRGGESLLREMFEPLGYTVKSEHHPLDERFPEWGAGPYFTVKLRGNVRLQDLLSHLYVLIPVLDAEKHYWVGKDEIEKLLRNGEGWLATHPQKEAITTRYLRFDRKLTRRCAGAGSPMKTRRIPILQRVRISRKSRKSKLR